jgi:Domain of unknown function (DUF4397)
MNRHSYIAALLCAGVLSACSKDPVRNISGPPPAASRVRFFNFGVNAPSVNFYANTTKMTAIQNSTDGVEATTGVAYGGVGSGGAYAAIAPGPYTFTGKIAATTDKDLSISPLAATIEDGKYYSYYMSGIYNTTTKTVDAFVVEDPVVAPTDFTIATVRFVHAISNANPMTLYAKSTVAPNTEYTIGAEVAYKGAGAFTGIPAGVYDLSTRYAGTATNAMTRTGVSFVFGRVYTVTARGDITVAATPTACGATNKTCLDNTANR